MKTDFTHTTALRVRYGETDQMGYCYYGNYAQYFEVGRVETMRQLGMPYKVIEEQGVMLPVSHMEIFFKAPAMYDDELNVKTTVTELNGPRLLFNYTITNASGKLIVEGTTTLVFVSKKTMKPIAPPSNFTDLLLKYQVAG